MILDNDIQVRTIRVCYIEEDIQIRLNKVTKSQSWDSFMKQWIKQKRRFKRLSMLSRKGISHLTIYICCLLMENKKLT